MAAVETKCAGYFTTSAQEEDDDGDDWGTKTLVLKARATPRPARRSPPRLHPKQSFR